MAGLGALAFFLGGDLVLQTITIAPLNSVIIGVGSQVQLVATGHYNDGSAVDITSSCSWVSDDGGVSVVAGLVTGLASGRAAHITAAKAGIVGDAYATVQKTPIVPVDMTAAALARIISQFRS